MNSQQQNEGPSQKLFRRRCSEKTMKDSAGYVEHAVRNLAISTAPTIAIEITSISTGFRSKAKGILTPNEIRRIPFPNPPEPAKFSGKNLTVILRGSSQSKGEKSRREKRKEARLVKKEKRFESWTQRQSSRKFKKISVDAKPQKGKKLKTSPTQASEKKEVQKRDFDGDSDPSRENNSSIEKYNVNVDSLVHLISDKVKMAKNKKGVKRKSNTKFEEYLEMDMKRGAVSANEDLELERKLAKKLKVKGGKLRGMDDEINMLFEGIPSISDSVENDEIAYDERTSRKSSKQSSLGRKNKKRKSTDVVENQKEDKVASETMDGELVMVDNSASEAVLDESPPKANKKRKSSGASNQGYEDGISIGTVDGEAELVKSSAEIVMEPSSQKLSVFDANMKYVAPHLRSHLGIESAEHAQIRRRVRGLLNRLSESNVESITAEMSTIYQSVVRSVGSLIISEEVLASCSGGPRGNEQYAAVFAGFVAGMACLVGIDFSAKLIASLAKSFQDEYLKEDNLSLRNLTLLLSHLCIFGVCSSDLVYDFLIMLSKSLMEIDVSTILTVLQCCGMKLRGDDPTAMKDFIVGVQKRANELKAYSENEPGGQAKIYSKRMEFMLETIYDIKNNKKRYKEDPPYHTRIKKWLQKLRVDDILLRGLKWSTLLDPHKKGQWWSSGDVTAATDDVEEVAKKIDGEVLEAQKLLQLAATQRMNTDARKAIFCIIMSGEDYLDAFEKLLRLDLPGKQDREIMRVLLNCCLQEKVVNKYYAILASKLCSHDKNHKFTLQYCLWDHYKEIESMELIKSMNLSRFVVEMLGSFSLSLAVLKTVELDNPKQLTPKRIMHFRMLFEAVFEFQNALVWNIFTRIAVAPELEALRNGLQFFIRQYVVNSNKSFTEKFKIARKALNNVEGVLM